MYSLLRVNHPTRSRDACKYEISAVSVPFAEIVVDPRIFPEESKCFRTFKAITRVLSSSFRWPTVQTVPSGANVTTIAQYGQTRVMIWLLRSAAMRARNVVP